ncbi:hypothetical protein LPJ56_003772 [Coemansia sp. RSA 2599]|nr:hypothetical protein LPJ56_003772 [Coemansia sp. RSA 2599]
MSGFPTGNLPSSASYDSSGPQPYNANPPYVPAGPIRPVSQRPPAVSTGSGGFPNVQSPMVYSPNINASMYHGNDMPMMQASSQAQQQQSAYATGPMMTPEQSRNPLQQPMSQKPMSSQQPMAQQAMPQAMMSPLQPMAQQQMPQPQMPQQQMPQQQMPQPQMPQQQMPQQQMPQPMQSQSASLQQSAPPVMHHSYSAPRPGQSHPAQTYPGSVHNGSSSDVSSVYNANDPHNNISSTPPAISSMGGPFQQQQEQQQQQQAQQQQQQQPIPNPVSGFHAPNSAGPEIPASGSMYGQQRYMNNAPSVIGNSYPPGSIPMRPMAGGFNGANYVPSPGGYGGGGPPMGTGYAPSMGPVPYGRPPFAPSMSSDDSSSTSRLNKAGKYALGALAAGAVAYGVHELVDGGSEAEKAQKTKRLQMEERERQRRESEARRRREEEEDRRREEHDKWRRSEDEKKRQEVYFQTPAPSVINNKAGSTFKPTYTPYGSVYGGGSVAGGRQRSESVGSRHSGDGFRPPAPFGQLPYTYDQNDVRLPDPSRSSENSSTPETYPELRQNPSDTTIKIGTILAFKHVATGRFLRSDRSHSTQSGSNQQLVYASKFTAGESDWWQVLPANGDVPVPGSIVAYGNQIRLRHVDTGRHLHSHYGFADPLTGLNEATCYGDQTLSDENDHWVIERWGDGGYGSTAKSTETIVLRHYVSGMALYSQDVLLRDDLQVVSCHDSGSNESSKWRIVLDS